MEQQHATNAVKLNELTRFSFQIPAEAAKLLKLISDKRSLCLKELGVALVDISEPGNLNGEMVLMPEEEVIKKELAIIQALTSNTKPNFNYMSSNKRRLDEDINLNPVSKRICQYNSNNQFQKLKSDVSKQYLGPEVADFKVPQPISSHLKIEQPISKLNSVNTLEKNLVNSICNSKESNLTDINKIQHDNNLKNKENKKLNIPYGHISKKDSDNLVTTSVPILNGTQTLSSLIRSFDHNVESHLYKDISDDYYIDNNKDSTNHKYSREYKYSPGDPCSDNADNLEQNLKRHKEQKNISPFFLNNTNL